MSVFKKAGSGFAILAASALVLSGCAAAEEEVVETTEEDTTSSAVETLELKIGTSLPITGNLAYLGPPEEAGVALAQADINAAAAGINLEVFFGDSGNTDNKAYETEIPRVLAEGVSAIVGAAASGVSLQFIDQVTKEAGVILFSPANTSPVFTDYDDDGLYFRTAPSDVLQGEVLGNLLAADGHETVGMIVMNDAYGTGLRDFTTLAFEAAGGSVVATPSFNVGDTNFSSQINELVAQDPDAIVVLAFDETKTIVPDLIDAGFSNDVLYFTDGNIADYSDVFAPGLIEGSKATLPGPPADTISDDYKTRANDLWVANGNDDLTSWAYSTESYDAVVLLALAALAAGSNEPKAMAAKLSEVSGFTGGGTKCTSFAECAEIINGGGVADYDGFSGGIALDEAGDPTDTQVGIYQYDAQNRPQTYLG
jgi:branched-chain amino acid transport system substrate-binding protein